MTLQHTFNSYPNSGPDAFDGHMVHTSPSRTQQYYLDPSKSERIRKLQTTLDVEKYPIAPKELELQQVHVHVRHGTLLS